MTERIRSPLIIIILLGVMIFAVYFNIFGNSPTNWDDPAIFKNTYFHSLTWDNLKVILTYRTAATYQPMRDLSYMIDFSIWGDKDENMVVFGIHLQSIILYILMIIACYAFLRELLRVFHDDPDECYIWAALTSVLFAMHPVHVESVAWLYARKEPLLGLFTFISLWAFIKARLDSWKYYLLSAAALLLAIMSKPTALIIPGVMFVLDIALQARLEEPSFWKRRLTLYIPILIVVVPMIVRLVTMMQDTGGIKPYHGGSFATNLLAVSQILISYIKLIGFTVNYSADYPIHLYSNPHTWQPWVFLGLNVLFVISAGVAFMKKWYLYGFFVAWYYIFLLPVSHIYPISQFMTDRYALLPSLSWCMLLGYLLTKLWHLKLEHSFLSRRFPMALAIGLFCFVTLFYAYMTFRQGSIWRNSQTLWEDTLAKYPNSSPANVNLAAIYIHQGRFPEVQELCLRAIKALPYDYLAISNLALAQMMMKQYDNAINNYKQALKLKPDLPEARMGLAYAYFGNRDYKDTYEMYTRLFHDNVTGSPHYMMNAYYQLGFSAWKIGRKDEAYHYLALAEPGMRQDKFLLSDLAGTYTSMQDMNKAYELYSALYPMLNEGDAKNKLSILLKALEDRLKRPKG
ncbi:MAG: tetratricopeptide repeat protein [Desulfomonilia bacterium]